MQFRHLTPADFREVHRAFLEAFSDYAVPFQISAPDLEEMLRRRGYVPEASIGVFDDGRLVAFTLNGLGEWNGRRTAYDTGTGVVPSHRGRNLSRQMIDAAIDLLRENGAGQYLLEVLQSNERAYHVYRDAGFEVTRHLQCWELPASTLTISPEITRVESVDWERVAASFDAAPSWQNSIDAVRRAGAPRSIFAVRDGDHLLGCAVVFENGDLPFIAVKKSARRRGLGTALILAAASDRALRILNVDTSLSAAVPFLERCGATRTVAQYEMLREI